jgi:tRNA threonylcarbamoyladenosine biosynthesis protein TsaE
MDVITHTDLETAALGGDLARRLTKGDVVACFGDLGSGKTRFIQGVCRGLGVREHVASPTFTIVNEYEAARCRVIHFDFYRVRSIEEILDIGFEEYLSSGAVCLIEWAEKAIALLPERRYEVRLSLGAGEHERSVSISEPSGVPA